MQEIEMRPATEKEVVAVPRLMSAAEVGGFGDNCKDRSQAGQRRKIGLR